ncbi:MAG TPA: hypothetical protein VNT60_07900 [Deinococcales bacterium]|nr:hypothetical protein [Deinococcales bacterium]
MLFVIIFAILVVVYAGVVVVERRVLAGRKRRGFEENDLDVLASGGNAFGGGIGAAYGRQIGLEQDEGPKAREDVDAPKFRLD